MIVNNLKLVWSDEFDKPIDKTLWGVYTREYGEESPYNNVFLKDNKLYIGRKRHDPDNDLWGCEFNTKRSLYFKYGYLEIKAKLARCPGCHSAFWLNSAGLPFDRLPEIDIYENFGNNDRLAHNLHRWWYDKDEKGNKIYTEGHCHHDQFAMQTEWQLRNTWLPEGETFCDKFHRIGLHWTPERMDFYVDGHCDVSIDITGEYFKDFHQPMYIILSHTVDKTTPDGITPTDDPSYDIFEYIRLYQDEKGVLQDKSKGELVLD